LSDKIPIVGRHRGVGLHDHQDAERLELVRQAIDHVLDLDDVEELVAFASNARHPPESRLLAGNKVFAILRQVATAGRSRPTNIDPEHIGACVAGLDSLDWRDRHYYASAFDHHMLGDPERSPVARPAPLDHGV
jgi:hypothetical protein